jgi:hypothetical protein
MSANGNTAMEEAMGRAGRIAPRFPAKTPVATAIKMANAGKSSFQIFLAGGLCTGGGKRESRSSVAGPLGSPAAIGKHASSEATPATVKA